MARRNVRSQLDTIAKIHLTPLLDLTFLLLIVFMITAPLLDYSLHVSTPEFNGNPLPDKNVCNVSLQRGGVILLEKEVVTADELVRQLQAMPNKEEISIVLRGDKSLTYGEVVEKMELLRQAGFTKVFQATTETDSRR